MISNNVVCATSKGSDQPAHMRSLIRAFASRLTLNLLNEHRMEALSLKGSGADSSESTHLKMPHCWKSHATAQFLFHMVLSYLLEPYFVGGKLKD